MNIAALAASLVHLWLWGTVALSPTVSIVKLEWTVVAGLGVLYSLDFVREGAKDWQALGRQPDPGDRLVVEILLLIGVFMVLVHTLLLALGGLSLFSVNAVGPVRPLNKAVGVFFVVVGQSLIFFLAAIKDKRTQLRHLAYDGVGPAT